MSAQQEANPAATARKYRAGVAKRLTRIERGIARIDDAVAVLLERQGEGGGTGDGGKRAAEAEGPRC